MILLLVKENEVFTSFPIVGKQGTSLNMNRFRGGRDRWL